MICNQAKLPETPQKGIGVARADRYEIGEHKIYNIVLWNNFQI